MLLQRANKYCAEPTPYQAQAMGQWVGACRFVYNIALEQRIAARRKGFRLDYNKQAKEITACRDMADWLTFAPVHAVQYALQHVEDAFARFFSGQNDHPKPRKKFKDDAFTLPAEDVEFKRLNKHHGAIKLPKIGWVCFRGFRKLGGRLRSVTFRRKAGKWSVSAAWDREIPEPPRIEAEPIGIDRGVAVFVATSVGELIEPLAAFADIKDKLAKLQKKLSRKVKFSSNWYKLNGKISRLRVHEANARKDFLHKVTTILAKSHGVYRLEKLRVKNMTASAKGTAEDPGKNVRAKAGLNRSILDQGWSMFVTFLGYKLVERGGRVEFTPAPYTSLRCPSPGCGHTHADNRPTRDRFCCVVCGYAGHADVVGAINVSQGRILPVEPPKRIRRRIGKRKPVEGIKHAA